MIIKLFLPQTRNWILAAEQLDDPTGWDRFVPCHSQTSQRWQFENTVKDLAETISKDHLCRMKPCKDLLARGTSVFEYAWEMEEDDILSHALLVADNLALDLLMEPLETASTGRHAA